MLFRKKSLYALFLARMRYFLHIIRCKNSRAFQKRPYILHILLSLDATCVLVKILTNSRALPTRSTHARLYVFPVSIYITLFSAHFPHAVRRKTTIFLGVNPNFWSTLITPFLCMYLEVGKTPFDWFLMYFDPY